MVKGRAIINASITDSFATPAAARITRRWTTDERSEMLPRRPCSGDSMGIQCGTCGRSKHMYGTLCRPSSTTHTAPQSLLWEMPEKVRDKRAKRPAGTHLGVDPDRFRYGSSSPFPLIEISACSPTVAKKALRDFTGKLKSF